jgi:hypothetical protein
MRAAQKSSAGSARWLVVLVFQFGGALVDSFAQCLAGFEVGDTLGRNGHGLTAARVASHARRAVADRKAAKAAHFDAVALHHGLADGVEQGLDGVFGVTLRQVAEPCRKGFNEVGSGHGKKKKA